MEFLSKIVEYPIELVGRLLGRQVGYVIDCRTNIQKLQDQVKELKAARETIKEEVAEAKTKGEKIRPDVELWLTTVDKITTKTDELLNDESQAKLKCLHGCCPNLTVRHQISRKSTKLLEEVIEQYGKKEFPQVSCGILRKEVLSVTTGDYLAFPSRMSIVKEIMDSLKDSDIKRMGVCGIGGVGKTTLVKEVYKLASEDKESFDSVVILLDLKKDPNPEAIQKIIVEKLGMDIRPGETKEGRASRLCARIHGKKILVILDDVQEKIELENMGLPRLPTCKILLTCRSRDVLSFDKMRADKVLELDLLGKKETWSLFKKMAGEIVDHKGHIQDVAVQVAEKCGGLPLLIVTVASALKEKKNASAWRNALRQLEACEKEDLTEQAYLALEWSYYQLDNTELQPLLLLCGIQVRHNRVYVVDLLKYGMGLGLFTNINTVEEARDKLETLIDKLKDFYLLLDGEPDDIEAEDSVRMHDLVCHVVNRIARRDQHVLLVEYGGDLKEWPDKDILRKCTKFSLRLHNIHSLPELPWECPEVELFLLQGENDESLEIPSNFFKEMEKLKVLDLTNMCLPLLPASMQYLKKLQTLCLDKCIMGDITLLGQLSCLEILSFYGSVLKELPKEIGQLTRLRVLDVSDCSELEVISPGVISSLVRLENLRMRNSFNNWEIEGGESNASLSELKHLSQLSALEIDIPNADVLPTNLFSHKLERFHITIGDAWFRRSTMTLNTLRLKLTKKLDESLKLLIKRSEELSLDETEVGTVHELDTEDFENVKHLQLQNNIDFTDLVNRKVVFPNLTTLRVHGCNKLRFLFSISMARSLVQLTHLQISECQLLQEIVSSTRESGEAKVDNMFSELKELKLRGLPKLIRFSTGNYIGFSALEELEIKFCYELVEFISDKVAMSSKDTRLICNYKESEQTISEEEDNLDVKSETSAQNFLFNEKVGFPRLEKLTISEVWELKVIWHAQLAQDSFRRLRQVIVNKCKNLISLFPASVMGRLNALETLEIKECESLEVVFELLRSSVKEIHVDTSSLHDQLKLFCCQNLGSVSIRGCNSLKSIFPASVARGLQQLTTLSVSCCDGIEEIVGEEDEEEVLETTPYHRFVFPDVTLVELLYLPQLTSFYPKLHVSQWPSLKQLRVVGCDKVGFLATEISHFGNEHEIGVMDPLMTSQKPLFLADKVVFPNLTTLRVHGCDKLRFLFSISMARSLVQLTHLHISACQLLQEIVSSTRESCEANMDNMFSELKVLELERLPKLIRFSIGNYIGFSALEELEIVACYELVEFISDKVAMSSKDTRLICNYKEIEQTISEEEENLDVKSETSVHNFLFDEKVGFPRLEKLIISELRELKVIWHVQLAQDSFRRLREVIVNKCKNLTSLFPPSVLGRLNALETLDIKECESLEVVFELFRSSVKEIHVDTSSPHERLKSFRCQNLGSVTIEECNSLKSIFPASVAGGLQQLTTLSVSRCDGIEEIVREEDEGVLETTPYHLFVFPNVRWLEFDSLPQLTSFYPKIHASQWPSLTELEVIKGCDKVGFFATEISHFGNEHEIEVMEPPMTSQKSLFLVDKDSFPNLEDLILTNMEIWNGPPPADQLPFGKLKSITFIGNCAPFSKQASVLFLRRLQNLEQIQVCYNDSCEEIFVNQIISSSSEALRHVRMLRLHHLDKLMHLGNGNSQSLLFPNLETLRVSNCARLQSLESSAISFRNLTTLEVFACNGLEYLTSYSVAKSLGKLKTFEVTDCESVVVILASNVGDDDADDTAGNEVFSHLQHLELSGLPSLQGFCSGHSRVKFPPSMALQVYSCPIKLKISPNGVLLTEKEDQDQDEQKEDVEMAQRNPEILSEKSAS